ncbi:hypothetical protein [Crenothrix polyspora]|uniref:Uncharacterized protein n=1 Tax=Crenothrix polyspora TaxID=360316 RepID=A0A1R4HEL5_9GAMM|nr:hypothetical protein [Crenothrix polyspora]SJM94646.1 conserved hypothetical protein [Crenothrix polyspora]
MRRNKVKPCPDDYWLWLVLANVSLCLMFLLFFIGLAWLSIGTAHAWVWQSPISFEDEKKPPVSNDKPPVVIHEPAPEPEQAPPPPEIKPYEIPTMRGNRRDFHYTPAIKLAPVIDADAVFQTIVNCFPERPKWGLDVKAVAGARMTDGGVSTFDTAGLSKFYGGIVAEMPLYSAEEMHKQRTQEYQRRGEVAANVAQLLKALADRQRALRMVGINESVEARSQLRVKEGLAPAEEQITNLKAVAEKVGDLDAANAAIVAARLTLVGQCRDEVAENVNDYLKEITQ